MARNKGKRPLTAGAFRTRTTLVLSALAGFVAMFEPHAAGAEPYRNQDFGFSLALPKIVARCTVEPGTNADGTLGWIHIDTGPGLFLDGKAGDCTELDSRPSAVFSASYNAWGAENVAQLIASYCTPDKPDIKRVAAPPDLKFASRMSGACRMDHEDGWIEIKVETQSGNRGVNYSAWLYTRHERLASDLKVFRAILKTVKFF